MQSKKGGRTRLLIYGSTLLTELCIEAIELHSDEYMIVGQIPNKKPPLVGGQQIYPPHKVPYDIKLSIQYDSIIKELTNAFNLHTGLLPEWGGCDILYHTLKTGVKEQGLTFHKMTKNLDEGPIISKIIYPILSTDDVEKIYKRILNIAPNFLLANLNLINNEMEELIKTPALKPIMYKKGHIDEKDKEEYIKTGEKLSLICRSYDRTRKFL